MIKAEVKIHNAVYECANCGELKKIQDNRPVAILKLQGIKPTQEKGADPKEYDMVYITVFVDRDCFSELELTDKEAPEIVKK